MGRVGGTFHTSFQAENLSRLQLFFLLQTTIEMTPSHSQSLGLDASSEQHQAVLKQVCAKVNEFSASSPQSRVKIMSQVMHAKDHEEASINILRRRLTQWLWKQMCLQNQKEKK